MKAKEWVYKDNWEQIKKEREGAGSIPQKLPLHLFGIDT